MSVPTLYRFYAADDALLYVGCSMNNASRLYQHSSRADWWREVKRATFEHFETWEEVLLAERSAIEAETPRHNVATDAWRVALGRRLKQARARERAA